MPYIAKERRDELVTEVPFHSGFGTEPDEPAKLIVFAHEIQNAGELNYAITMIVRHYIKHIMGFRYQHFCEVEGVLSHVSKEVYRRMTSKYEDEKIEENGDVF